MLGDFKFQVCVLARHPESDVSEIAIRLGKEPKHVSRRGMPTPAGLPFIYFENRCLVELASNGSGTLAECVSAGVDMLMAHREYVHQVTSTGGSIELIARWYPNGDTGESFPPDMMAKLGSLGVQLGFNVYGVYP